jgi:O-antigen ligase/polysaccharide polymerase Wzy-like membrane protein
MNNVGAFLRSVITFAVIVPLALVIGYLLTGPLDYSTEVVIGIVAAILVFPLLLRWHYPLLLLCWNMAAVAFFLPGSPSVCLLMVSVSLGISVLQRMISKNSEFISVPQITFPLLCLLAVIAITAKLTGLGLRTFGGNVYGGKKYVYLVGGILGYFALSAQRIPPGRRNLYLGLFFLGGLTAFIGDIFPWLPRWTYFIYDFFSYNQYYFTTNDLEGAGVRFTGAVGTALAVFGFLLVRYGIRGVFLDRKHWWRWAILIAFVIYSLLGGFRTIIILFGLTFVILFCLERLYRTKLLPIFLVVGLVGGLALIPLAPHLPYTFQRALSFLPLNIDPVARADADDSTNWRVKMWQSLLPQVPQYLLRGKGYVISPLDYNFVMGWDASVHSQFAESQGMALAEDFHNGPFSVVIPLGIWGVITFLWFLSAGVRVVYANYRYGDPELHTANSFLLAAFVAQGIFFLFVFGDLSADMLKFCGWLGLSVSLNGGMCRPAKTAAVAAKPEPPADFRKFLPRPAPAFQRRTG